MFHGGENHPEKEHQIQLGLKKHSGTRYEDVPLSKIILGSKIVPIGLVKIRTNIPPRVKKNKFDEYFVIDGRHRIFNFYLNHFPPPHNIKIGCLVEDDTKDRHYAGYNVWQAAEKLHINPRRSAFRKFFNFFGLFRKSYDYFSLSNDTRNILSRKTILLIESVEDKLDDLYDDFIARTCEFMAKVKSDKYAGNKRHTFKKLASYEATLTKLVSEEEEDESLLEQLSSSMKNDLVKSSSKNNKEIRDAMKILDGDSKNMGLIRILRKQLRIIKTRNIQDDSKFEEELLQELKYAKNLLEARRKRLFSQLHKLLQETSY